MLVTSIRIYGVEAKAKLPEILVNVLQGASSFASQPEEIISL